MKKYLVFLLALTIVLSSGFAGVFADETPESDLVPQMVSEEEPQTVDTNEEQPELMSDTETENEFLEDSGLIEEEELLIEEMPEESIEESEATVLDVEYPDAVLESFDGGYYFKKDTLDVDVTLPTGYTAATLSLNNNTVKTFDPTVDLAGEHIVKVALEAAGAVEQDVTMKLSVTEADTTVVTQTTSFFIFDSISVTNIFDNDFAGTSKGHNPGGYESATDPLDSNNIVYKASATGNKSYYSHATTTVLDTNDYIFDFSYDIMVNSTSIRNNMDVSVYGISAAGVQSTSRTNLTLNGFNGNKALMESGKVCGRSDITYAANEWHNVRAVFYHKDYDHQKGIDVYVYFDGKFVLKQAFVPSSNGDYTMPYRFGAYPYISSGAGVVYIDNLKVDKFVRNYSISCEGGQEGLIAYNSPTMKLKFSHEMTQADVEAKTTVTSFNGASIDVNWEYDSVNKYYMLSSTNKFVPGKPYKIKVAEGLTSNAGCTNDVASEFVVYTTDASLALGDITYPAGSLGTNSEFVTTVKVKNSTGSEVQGALFVGFYCDGKLYSINVKEISGSEEEIVVPVTLKTPSTVLTGEKEIKCFFVGGKTNYILTDFEEGL